MDPEREDYAENDAPARRLLPAWAVTLLGFLSGAILATLAVCAALRSITGS